jgi:hypothetical protein
MGWEGGTSGEGGQRGEKGEKGEEGEGGNKQQATAKGNVARDGKTGDGTGRDGTAGLWGGGLCPQVEDVREGGVGNQPTLVLYAY